MTKSYSENRILLVDDSAQVLESTSAALRECGFEYIFLAENGLQGFEKTLEYAPDLVIADMMMPEVDGYAYCRMVRELNDFKSMPIIVQSGEMQPERRAEAFHHGATDVLLKPVSREELKARVCVHVDRMNLMREFRQYRGHVEEEARQARIMQQEILPSELDIREAMADRPLRLSSHFVSSEALSGDIWGIAPLSPHQLAFYLVDFTGHGLLAALNTFRLHTLMHSECRPSADPGAYLTALNALLHPLLPRNHFATMFYGIVDTQAHLLRFASAASPGPLLFQADGRITTQDVRSLPLSVRPDTVYETISVAFAPGDTLMCFSDALIEAEIPGGGGIFERELLEQICRRLAALHKNALAARPDMITRHVLAGLYGALGTERLEDDLTLLVLGYPSGSAFAPG